MASPDETHETDEADGAARDAGGVWAPARRTLTVGLVLTITLVGFEALAISTVMPAVSRDLGGLGLYGWVFSAYFLGNLVGIVIAGQRADREGPGPPFAAGLGLFAAGLLVGGLAPTMPVLIGARVAQGLGAGAIPSVAYVAVGRGYPPGLRPRLFALFSTAWVLPGLVGPALSGTVADNVGWRWVFLGLLPLTALTGVMTLPSLRRFPAAVDTPPVIDRRLGALQVAIGAGLVLAGISSGSPVVGAALAVPGAVIGFRAFVRLVPEGTLRLRTGLPAAVLVRGILTFAFFAADAYVSLALTSVRGTSITVAGIALTAATLAWAAGAWVQERQVHTRGPRRLVRGGFILIVWGIAGLGSVLLPSVPLPAAIVVWAVAGFGMGISYAPLSLTVLGAAAPGQEGAASASLQLSDTLGIALGTGASGAAVALGDALAWTPRTALGIAFALAAAVGIAGFAAAARLPRTLPTHTP